MRIFGLSCLLFAFGLPALLGGAETGPPMTDITKGLKLIDEIDTTKVAPDFESEDGGSGVHPVAGREARVMVPGEKSKVMAYVLGKGKGLEPGKAYVIDVEYPDDVPRTMFFANRGADYTRGISTGSATGDVRSQFAEPSVESLAYPQSGQWKDARQFFFLLNKFQGVKSVRDPKPGCRPYKPEDGFHFVIFQPKKINDPRSEGAAIGRIRLYEVPDPQALYARINYPPDGLPRRHIFWREEMADQIIQTDNPDIQAVNDSIDWYEQKMRMAKVLGINTFAKDLLEFGFNQGWETDDGNWVIEAQPPNRDLWTRLALKAGEEGMELMPYYEYKTGIGMAPDSLAKQRRAHKLYHGQLSVNGNKEWYTGVYWTEGHNGDITDPDTLADAKRMMDKTVLKFKDVAKFAGVWFRPRNTHLPISFAPAALERFKTDNSNDADAQAVSQEKLIESYQGDRVLYDKYIAWWFKKRAAFLAAIQDYLKKGLNQDDVQVLFTSYVGEAVPTVHSKGQFYGHPGLVTDDPQWWLDYANTFEESWWKYHWMPTPYEKVVEDDLYREAITENPPIIHNLNSGNVEQYHSAPPADPENYKDIEGVMMTFPIGRLFILANPQLLEDFRAKSGLTVMRHYPLNEEHEEENVEPSPFDHLVGYISVDSDRAGDHLMLQQARAMAYGDPRNIGYLSGSSFSTWNPEVMRRFNQAYLALPALPSKVVTGACADPDVVVREIPTQGKGTYYFVVNTSMEGKKNVTIKLPGVKEAIDLVSGAKIAAAPLKLDMDSAQLNSYHVGP